MANTDYERLKLIIEADYKDLESQTKNMTMLIFKLSKDLKMSIRDTGKILKDIFPDMKTEINGVVKSIEASIRATQKLGMETEKILATYRKLNQARKFSSARQAVDAVGLEWDFDLRRLAEQEKHKRELARIRESAIDSSGKIALANEMIARSERGILDTSIPLNAKQRELLGILKGLETQAPKSGQGLLSFSNFSRTAFGTLTAIAIFHVLNTITIFFQSVLKKAQEFRGELLELNLAEAILSKKGMDITRKDFDDLIKYIRGRYAGLSELEATKIVAETATAVQEFDVNAEQYKGLTDAIAFVQTKNKLLGKEVVDAGRIMNALMDARSNFFNGMGINITEQLILEKAYAMGLLKTGEAMSKEIRFQAALALFIEQTSSKQEDLNRQLENTPLGRQIALQEEWDDAMLRVGKSLITIKDNLTEFLLSLSPELANSVIEFFENSAREINKFIDAIQQANDAYRTYKELLEDTNWKYVNDGVSSFWKNLLDVLNPLESILGILQILGTILATVGAGFITFFLEVGAGFSWKTALQDAGRNAGEAFISGLTMALTTILEGEDNPFANWIKRNWLEATGRSLESLGTGVSIDSDTPTGDTTNGAGDELLEEEKNLQDALERMNNEILESQIKLAQDMEDAQIDLGRKLVDIATEYAKKRADAERDYANAVRDINSEYQSKIQDINISQQQANAEARNNELQKEAEFQNKMLELKEKFLMDLEDALHARDARQVLRLVKQYNLEKTQAEREYELEKEKDKRENSLRNKKFAQDRERAQRERQAKLQEAQQEYQDKLAKLKADEEAERAAAELAYQRKIEDLEREMHNRLEIVGANLIAEFNLTKAGLDAILALYHRYYKDVTGIYQAMNTMLAGQGNISLPSFTTSGGKGSSGGGGSSHLKMAEGGSILANKPTNVTFGEAGLELATFTPLNKSGRDVNKVFSSVGGSVGVGGKGLVELLVTLSPDLKAQIVREAMGQTAGIITKISRSKN